MRIWKLRTGERIILEKYDAGKNNGKDTNCVCMKVQGIRCIDAQMANKMEQKDTREAFSPEMAGFQLHETSFKFLPLAAVEIPFYAGRRGPIPRHSVFGKSHPGSNSEEPGSESHQYPIEDPVRPRRSLFDEFPLPSRRRVIVLSPTTGIDASRPLTGPASHPTEVSHASGPETQSFLISRRLPPLSLLVPDHPSSSAPRSGKWISKVMGSRKSKVGAIRFVAAS